MNVLQSLFWSVGHGIYVAIRAIFQDLYERVSKRTRIRLPRNSQIAHSLNVGDRWGAALPSLLGSRVLLNTREVVEKQTNATSIRTSFIEGFVEETTVPRSVGDT